MREQANRNANKFFEDLKKIFLVRLMFAKLPRL